MWTIHCWLSRYHILCSKRRNSECGVSWACAAQKPWSPWQLHRARPCIKKHLFQGNLVGIWQKQEDTIKRQMKMKVSTLNLFYFISNLAQSWQWLVGQSTTLLTFLVICKTRTHTCSYTHSSPASRVWDLHLSFSALNVHSTTSHRILTWPNCVKSILTQPLFFFFFFLDGFTGLCAHHDFTHPAFPLMRVGSAPQTQHQGAEDEQAF